MANTVAPNLAVCVEDQAVVRGQEVQTHVALDILKPLETLATMVQLPASCPIHNPTSPSLIQLAQRVCSLVTASIAVWHHVVHVEALVVVRDQEALPVAALDILKPLATLVRMDQLPAFWLTTQRTPRILKVIQRAKMVYSPAMAPSAAWSRVVPVEEVVVPGDLVALQDVVWVKSELPATLATRASPHV